MTRKITRALERTKAGVQDKLYLCNFDAVRDWGYALEHVEGMWRMLQAQEPEDYVPATGVGATVAQFAAASCATADLDYRDHVEIDPAYYRPAEVDYSMRDPCKAEPNLGSKASTHWEPLAQLTVRADVCSLGDQLASKLVRVDR